MIEVILALIEVGIRIVSNNHGWGDERMGPGIADRLGEARQVEGRPAGVGAIEAGQGLERGERDLILEAELRAVGSGVTGDEIAAVLIDLNQVGGASREELQVDFVGEIGGVLADHLLG